MEKRREERIKKRIPVRFYFEGQGFLSFTGDLSRRGVFIQAPNPCPAGKGINIEFETRGGKIQLAGYIIWTKTDLDQPWLLFPGGMGVQLLNYQKQEYQTLVGAQQ